MDGGDVLWSRKGVNGNNNVDVGTILYYLLFLCCGCAVGVGDATG